MSEQIPYPFFLSSAEQSRETDRRTIEEFGIDGFTLMEIAGTRAADYIRSHFSPDSIGLIFCGKGNNAGDALVAGRLLHEQGYDLYFCFAQGTEDLSPDTARNLNLLRELIPEARICTWPDLPEHRADFIVDGLLGTGVSSDLRSPYDEIIRKINETDAEVFSMDIPTGIHPDRGTILGEAVSADHTLSFGMLKAGCYLDEGFDRSGTVVLCELPFPNKFKKAAAYLIDEDWVYDQTPVNKRRDHKYDDGILYIIAGSEGLTGAATFAARSAWSTGLGAVVLITPKGLLPTYEELLPEVIKKTVGTDQDTYFKPNHLDQIKSILAGKKGDLLVGPGLGRQEETVSLVQELLKQCEGRITIDADGIWALSQAGEINKPSNASWLITPHPGELKSLLDQDMQGAFDRLIQSCGYASKNNLYILSKGLPSILGTPQGKGYITSYDTRIFSRAGFGDILAGKCAAFALQFSSLYLGALNALLDGKSKAIQHLENTDTPLEPTHLI
ncbi:NAD(P)H-hydrate epimerase [Balneola sp. MJW-20]|uniref:NAD(P)H-hydrate epimerase n=1 Tax=Gracilimonas aurantiaca TaxID=3234185 RepID=UPI003465936C